MLYYLDKDRFISSSWCRDVLLFFEVRGTTKLIGLLLFDRIILYRFLLEIFHELFLKVSLFTLIADSFEIIFNLVNRILLSLCMLREGIQITLFKVNFMFDVERSVACKVLIVQFLHMGILYFTCFYWLLDSYLIKTILHTYWDSRCNDKISSICIVILILDCHLQLISLHV